ncbi:MAG: TM2 domain-containing protein [Gemmatimonadales bacterium]|nr:TM2 domain-containing protein [Gemmatimonadales bacterium]MDZ4258973.1 TM2 domain-containing protein [Gemmatimonadales bacterium]MDZ4390100.1 TM2 domain-containing protein [Gemmatimonadales bacterium]
MTDDIFASPKSRTTVMLLAAFLGVFGAHRFHVGKIRSGVLMALTLGGLGLWWLYDIITIASGSFRDDDGALVANWEPEADRLAPPETAGAILEELDQLRLDIGELHERLEFAERLLADPERRPGPST